MLLATMRFSDYEWKYNPVTLKVTNGLAHSKRQVSLRNEEVVDARLRVKVVTGKGELMGEDCLLQYEEIEQVFLKGAKGVLTLPGYAPMHAYFTGLSAQATDTPQVIEYSFEFTQAQTSDRKVLPSYHTANGLETLYGIAGVYGVTVEKLVALNPWIKRPDEQLAGKKVRLC